MRTRAPKNLVIDACVAQRSSVFRELLEGVRELCHSIAMSRDVRAEWERHETDGPQGSREWRSAMAATKVGGRRKLEPVRPPLDEDFRERVAGTAHGPRARAAILKDMRLVEAALAADGIVISLDNNARKLMRAAAESCPELRPIVWVNPEEMDEDALREWLEEGAPSRPELTLGAPE